MTQSYATRPQHYSLKGIAIFADLSANALARIRSLDGDDVVELNRAMIVFLGLASLAGGGATLII